MRTTLLLFFACLLALPFSYTQQNPVDLYHAWTISNPQRYGDGIWQYFVQANNHYTQGAFEEAILSLDNATAQDPYFAEAYLRKAQIKYRIGRYTEARQDFQRAIQLNPGIAEMHSLDQQGNRLDVLAFEPNELLSEINGEVESGYYYQWVMMQSTEYLEVLEQADRNSYWQTTAEFERAYELIQDGNLTEATNLIQSLQQQEPNNPITLDLLGLCKLRRGENEQAIEHLNQTIALAPNAGVPFYHLSLAQRALGNYSEALVSVQKAIRNQPELIEAYLDEALILERLGRGEEAQEAYAQAEATGMIAQHTLLLHRGITRKLSGDIVGALADINYTIRETESPSAQLFKIRGNLYLMLGDHFAAIADYSHALELDNTFAQAFYNRALARMLAYNRTDACFDFEQAMELGYEDAKQKLEQFCSF
jgi:tetratricopeptide (TPR) repeat protein